MSIPLVIITVPLIASAVVYAFRQWVWIQSVLAVLSCSLLIILTLQVPLEQMVVFAGWDVMVETSWEWMGRSFVFEQSDRPVLTFIFSASILFFAGASATRVSPQFVPVGLALLSFLVATFFVYPFLYASLFLLLATIVAAFMILDGNHRSTRGSLRMLLFTTLALPFIMMAGSQIEIYHGNPDSVMLLGSAMTFLGVGCLIMLAAFPFHSWMPMVAQDASPYVAAFIFSVSHSALFLFFLDTFSQYAWFRDNTSVLSVLYLVGMAMVIVGAVFAFGQRSLGRLMGYSVTIDGGAALLALGLGTPDSLQVAISIVGLRVLALALWGLGLNILSSEVGGDFERLRGKARIYPFATGAMLIGGFSVAGLPLTAGFMGRWPLLHSLARQDLLSALVLLLASVSVTIAYMRGIKNMLGGPSSERSKWSVGESPVTIIFAVVGVLAVLGLGAYPQWILPTLRRTVDAIALFVG